MLQSNSQSVKDAPHSELADFSQDARTWLLAAMAIVVGAMSAPVAFALLWLIGVITNLVFFQRFSSAQVSLTGNHLGAWVILAPAAGGLIIGLMGRAELMAARQNHFSEEQLRDRGWLAVASRLMRLNKIRRRREKIAESKKDGRNEGSAT
jgi:hypothetical protein